LKFWRARFAIRREQVVPISFYRMVKIWLALAKDISYDSFVEIVSIDMTFDCIDRSS